MKERIESRTCMPRTEKLCNIVKKIQYEDRNTISDLNYITDIKIDKCACQEQCFKKVVFCLIMQT